MEGWIKKPNTAHIANSSSARKSDVKKKSQMEDFEVTEDMDDIFDDLEDPFEDEISMNSTTEDEKMQNSEAYFNQQMEEFRQKSAELQRLIDAQQAQAAANPYMAPQSGTQGNMYGQTPYGAGYGQAAQAPYGQMNYGQPVQPQNAYAQNPYNQAMPQMEQYPRYPYPSPQMQPGMGQMPQAGVDGIRQTPAAPEPILHTMDLSGIVGELEQVVNTGIKDGMGQMREDIGSLQTGFEGVKDDVSSLRSDMTGLSQSVSSATADLSSIQDEIAKRIDEATKSIAEETRQTLSETKSTIEEATKTISQNTQSFEGLKEQLEAIVDHGERLDGLTEQVDEVKNTLSTKIHEENVKEFRNIKQTIEESTKEGVSNTDSLGGKLIERLEETERKLKEQTKRQTILLVFSIVDFIGVLGILLLQSGIIK